MSNDRDEALRRAVEAERANAELIESANERREYAFQMESHAQAAEAALAKAVDALAKAESRAETAERTNGELSRIIEDKVAQLQALHKSNDFNGRAAILQRERAEKAERERDEARRRNNSLRNRMTSALDSRLCEMRPNEDDSISGFNDAWDVVRSIFDADAKANEG
jgi:CRISPR/Cas system-associated protein Cas10 (large subunit of type III CRISPR-Cas system)